MASTSIPIMMHTPNRYLRFSAATLMTLVVLSFDATAQTESGVAKVVCFGDSITKRGYPQAMGKLLGVECINAGVGGHNTSQGLRRMSNDVLESKPDVVVIFFGTNDMRMDSDRAHVPVQKYASNLERMIDACEKQGAAVVLCTVPPIDEGPYFTRHDRGDFARAGGLGQVLQAYRNAALRVADRHSVSIVDLNQLLQEDPDWLSPDGVHPSQKGNAMIAKHVAQAVRPLLP